MFCPQTPPRALFDLHERLWALLVNPIGDKVRYLQVEVFDYNTSPGIKATWRWVRQSVSGFQLLGNFTLQFRAKPEQKSALYNLVSWSSVIARTPNIALIDYVRKLTFGESES